MSLFLRDKTFQTSSFPLVMGILNVTPDSFSDGGQWLDPDRAVEHAMRMIADGAAIIDVGPESTRPGSSEVPVDEQIRRAIPVIRDIRRRNAAITLSIDTRSASVAEAAIEAGADIVNDVSALRDDPAMVRLIARRGVPVVLMHRRGTSATMQAGGGPQYENVIDEIRQFLLDRKAFAVAHGIPAERILFDPGIGFGKRTEHNLQIMNRLAEFVALGQPVLLGASRKRFLGEVLAAAGRRSDAELPPPDVAGPEPRLRDPASLACVALAALSGAAVVRVHDVRATCDVLAVLRAVRA